MKVSYIFSVAVLLRFVNCKNAKVKYHSVQNVPKMLTGADVSLLLLDKEKASLVAHTLMYYSVCVFKIPKKRDSRNFN